MRRHTTDRQKVPLLGIAAPPGGAAVRGQEVFATIQVIRVRPAGSPDPKLHARRMLALEEADGQRSEDPQHVRLDWPPRIDARP
jgi:hypothetical protein